MPISKPRFKWAEEDCCQLGSPWHVLETEMRWSPSGKAPTRDQSLHTVHKSEVRTCCNEQVWQLESWTWMWTPIITSLAWAVTLEIQNGLWFGTGVSHGFTGLWPPKEKLGQYNSIVHNTKCILCFYVINYDLPFLVVKSYLLGQDRDSGLFKGLCYRLKDTVGLCLGLKVTN